MKNTLIITSLILTSCQSPDSNKSKVESKSKILVQSDKYEDSRPKPAYPSKFLDSIASGFVLSTEQIRKYTNIDSIYYTGIFSSAKFAGDTVFTIYDSLSIGILEYDDRQSCIYKFFLIPQNWNYSILDGRLVYSDCDHDVSAGYSFLRYKILNDSIYETTETYIQSNNSPKHTKSTIWKIDQMGHIDTGNNSRH